MNISLTTPAKHFFLTFSYLSLYLMTLPKNNFLFSYNSSNNSSRSSSSSSSRSSSSSSSCSSSSCSSSGGDDGGGGGGNTSSNGLFITRKIITFLSAT